jgi:hypothetical protein
MRKCQISSFGCCTGPEIWTRSEPDRDCLECPQASATEDSLPSFNLFVLKGLSHNVKG